MLPIALTFGAINALVPLMVIVILIAAGAGLMRGYDIFTILGISTLAGVGSRTSTKGSLAKKTSLVKPTVGQWAKKLEKGKISGKVKGSVIKAKNTVFAGTGLFGTTSDSAQVEKISGELKEAAGVKPTKTQQARKLATRMVGMAVKGAAMVAIPGMVGTNKRLASKKDAEMLGVPVGSVISNTRSLEEIRMIEQRDKDRIAATLKKNEEDDQKRIVAGLKEKNIRVEDRLGYPKYTRKTPSEADLEDKKNIKYVGPYQSGGYPQKPARSLSSDLDKLEEEIRERNVTGVPSSQQSMGYPAPNVNHGTAPITDKQRDDRVRSLLELYSIGGAPIVNSTTEEKFNAARKAIRNKLVEEKYVAVEEGTPVFVAGKWMIGGKVMDLKKETPVFVKGEYIDTTGKRVDTPGKWIAGKKVTVSKPTFEGVKSNITATVIDLSQNVERHIKHPARVTRASSVTYDALLYTGKNIRDWINYKKDVSKTRHSGIYTTAEQRNIAEKAAESRRAESQYRNDLHFGNSRGQFDFADMQREAQKEKEELRLKGRKNHAARDKATETAKTLGKIWAVAGATILNPPAGFILAYLAFRKKEEQRGSVGRQLTEKQKRDMEIIKKQIPGLSPTDITYDAFIIDGLKAGKDRAKVLDELNKKYRPGGKKS